MAWGAWREGTLRWRGNLHRNRRLQGCPANAARGLVNTRDRAPTIQQGPQIPTCRTVVLRRWLARWVRRRYWSRGSITTRKPKEMT